MSILDDTKRAQKGAKTLLALIADSTPETFEGCMDEYVQQDGIIGTDFLAVLDRAKAYLPELGIPGSENDFFNFPIEFQMAFLERILEESRYDFLPILMETADEKHFKKLIKRRIHELKSKGIEISEPKKKGGFKFRPVVEPEPATIISESNSMGEREIFYAARSPRSGLRLLYAVSHFSEGIVEFNYFETSRSGMRDMIKSLRADSALEIFEVDQPLGFYFLESARKRNEQSGRPYPAKFMTVFQEFPKPGKVPDSPPVWNFITPDEVEKRFSDYLQSNKLHQIVEMRNWILPSEILRTVEHRFSEILYSTVLIDKEQKEQQIEELITDTIDGYFDEATRKLWIPRFEESAFFLAKNDMKDSALLAMTVARALSQPGRSASSIPFCDEMLRKLIKSPQNLQENETEEEKEEKTSSGGIILP
jgi:hypothetical protein